VGLGGRGHRHGRPMGALGKGRRRCVFECTMTRTHVCWTLLPLTPTPTTPYRAQHCLQRPRIGRLHILSLTALTPGSPCVRGVVYVCALAPSPRQLVQCPSRSPADCAAERDSIAASPVVVLEGAVSGAVCWRRRGHGAIATMLRPSFQPCPTLPPLHAT